MPGLIGKKLGMTTIFTEDRRAVPCTLIEVGPCTVTQIKSKDTDGYNAVQIGFGEKRDLPSRLTNQMRGHFKKAGSTPKQILREFDFNPADYKLGDVIKADYLEEGVKVDVVGTSKGKGFQGVVKRHGFAGVGGQTHGQHNRLRAPGSMGACSFPSRVFKGKRLGGQMGDERVKMKNLKVMKVLSDKNLVIVSGSVPGANGSYVLIYKK